MAGVDLHWLLINAKHSETTWTSFEHVVLTECMNVYKTAYV